MTSKQKKDTPKKKKKLELELTVKKRDRVVFPIIPVI